MRKWLRYTSPLVIAVILLSFVLKPFSAKVEVPNALKVKKPTEVLFPKNKTIFTNAPTIFIAPPFIGSSYVGFKEALAFRESQGNYFITNTLGYLGKYQFGVGTLQLMGVHNATSFLHDPVLQEKVFQTNIARNKWILRREIKEFEGKKIGKVEITESGMLAAAHLAGPGNVIKYLRSYGKSDMSDAYGTSLSKYLTKFSGYDISNVAPKRNPKIL